MYKILIIIIHILIFFSFDAIASTSIEGTMCNAYNIATGPAGKVLGSFAIVSLGVGFFTGRISWTLMVAVSVGIASMTAAPQIVSVLTNKDVAQCIDGTYITICEDGKCYSCPSGYGGDNCESCGVGFTGPNCSICDVGYRGEDCSECDIGYGKYQGVCYKDCTISEVGIADTFVKGGSGVVSCNAANFTGSMEYSCLNNSLSITNKSCSCSGNYTGSNCSTCLDGYTLSSGCEDCDTGYTKVNSICYKDCYAENIEGVNNKIAIPLNGTLGCDVSGFSGSVSYDCKDGSFTLKSNQYCINNSRCYGGDEDYDLMVSGKRYRVHKFTKVGSANLNCYSDKTLEYLIVGGGGGGGNGGQAYDGNNGGAGGGGAGGFLSGTMSTKSKSTLSIFVGSGGSAGVKGGDSSLENIIAYGGGFGAYPGQAIKNNTILNGGSGGGASDFGLGGLGVSGQGSNGCSGSGSTSYTRRGGGGGGAGPLKTCHPFGGSGGPGIDGKASSITGTLQYYAAGGGGAGTSQGQDASKIAYYSGITYSFPSASGIGGIAALGTGNFSVNGTSGKENTGSGGGGGTMFNKVKGSGGSGGSGIVVVRYAY